MSEIFLQNPELKRLASLLFKARERGDLLLQSGDVGWASAPSNIALLKYWGKKPGALQLPLNSNLSLTLPGFRAFTQVSVQGRFAPLIQDEIKPFAERPPFTLELNRRKQPMPAKMELFLKALLHGYADDVSLSVQSVNNFPTACGVASSAAGYAALVGAVADVLLIQRFFTDEEIVFWISEWARLGSGSATRSAIVKKAEPGAQFVAWQLDPSGSSSATSELLIHPEFLKMEHCLLVLDETEKEVGSSQGHLLAQTSLLQDIRLAQYPERYNLCKKALSEGDFHSLKNLAERDAFEMHAVMSDGAQAVRYISKETSHSLAEFVRLRDRLSAKMLWTLDAGANPHFLFMPEARSAMSQFFQTLAASSTLHPRARVLFSNTQGAGLLLGESAQVNSVLRSAADHNLIQQMHLTEAADFFSRGSEK